ELRGDGLRFRSFSAREKDPRQSEAREELLKRRAYSLRSLDGSGRSLPGTLWLARPELGLGEGCDHQGLVIQTPPHLAGDRKGLGCVAAGITPIATNEVSPRSVHLSMRSQERRPETLANLDGLASERDGGLPIAAERRDLGEKKRRDGDELDVG